jgi:hypothetical protein
MERGMAQVRELVEQPDREVRADERDVDDRKAPRPQSVRERKRPSSLSPASPSEGAGLPCVAAVSDLWTRW